MRLFQWDRDFGVFFCTQGISNIGDAAWGVLIPLYVLQLTHNPLQVSAIAIIEAVAFACSGCRSARSRTASSAGG